jgi:hypothetical protein
MNKQEVAYHVSYTAKINVKDLPLLFIYSFGKPFIVSTDAGNGFKKEADKEYVRVEGNVFPGELSDFWAGFDILTKEAISSDDPQHQGSLGTTGVVGAV